MVIAAGASGITRMGGCQGVHDGDAVFPTERGSAGRSSASGRGSLPAFQASRAAGLGCCGPVAIGGLADRATL